MGCGGSKDVAGGGLSQPNPQRKGVEKGEDGARTLKLSNSILEHAGDVRDSYTFDKVLGKGNFGVSRTTWGVPVGIHGGLMVD